MRKPLAVAAAVGVAAAFALASQPASAQSGNGTVTVIHGVPGVTVDVYVNDDLTLEDFAPETVTDPIELPAGDYQVDIRPADAPDTDPPIISSPAPVTLPAGANATLIAHLDAAGTPTLGVFVNDTAPTPAGQGRLVVRHTAAAPAVDVLAGGSPVIEGLENPDEAVLTLPAGTVSASVAAAGTTDPVIGPADVPVVAGQVTIVYAFGSLEEQSLGVLVQTLQVGEEEAPAEETTTTAPVPVPDEVPAGGAGLAADSGSGFPVGVAAALGMVAMVGLVASARSLAEAKSRS
jgi:hypothetical protein